MLARNSRLDGGLVLNPGQCRELITWQKKIVPAFIDTFGEDKAPDGESAWEDVTIVKAEIRAGQGREVRVAQQTWPEAKYVITHSFFDGLSADMRIIWQKGEFEAKILNVLDVNDPIGTRRYISAVARDYTG